MPRNVPRAKPRKPFSPRISPGEFKTFPTQFLRAWVATYYSKQEDDAHAENDARDAAELQHLTRIGAYQDWQKRRKKH